MLSHCSIYCLQVLYKSPLIWLRGFHSFFTGKISIRTGESRQRTINPALSKELNTGLMPSVTSGLSGYCVCMGLNSDLVITTGSTPLIRPTPCLPFAHTAYGFSFTHECTWTGEHSSGRKKNIPPWCQPPVDRPAMHTT